MSGIIPEMQRVVAGVIGDSDQALKVVYALLKEFGGERIYIPHNGFAERNAEIKSMHNAGVSVQLLAMRYRLSKMTIYRIIGSK